MNFRRQRRENLEISITPMIDVVFLLLIFFMVTTTFNRQSELQIKLPEAQGAEAESKEFVEIAVDPSGTYFVNGEQVVNTTPEMLKKAISEAAGDSSNPPLVIAADAAATHQSVIRVLDVIGQLGFVKVTFAASKPAGGSKQ